MKVCSKCKKEKELDEFHKMARNKDGKAYQCKECRNEYFKKHSKTQKFKDTVKKYQTSKKGIDRRRKYEKEYNKTEKRKEYLKWFRQKPEQKTRVKRNNENFFKSEKGREYTKKWRKTIKGRAKSNYHCAMRRARKLQATPPWLTKEHKNEIREIYIKCQEITKETGIMHHVDHIIPLAGENISGLHVSWNLQIIKGTDNCKKNNKMED